MQPNAVILDHIGDAWQLNSAGGERWSSGPAQLRAMDRHGTLVTFSALRQFLVTYDGGITHRAAPADVDT